MNTEERDPDDPCFGCLLDGNCTSICPKALPYFKAQVETRPGRWINDPNLMCLVWKEETDDDNEVIVPVIPEPKRRINFWVVIVVVITLLSIITLFI